MSVSENARERGLPDVDPTKRATLIAPSPDEKVGRFTLRQLGVLQWVGTMVAPITWYSQHLVGYGVGQAVCRSGGLNWGVNFDLWQMLLLAVGGLFCVGSWFCALAVFLHVKGADWGDGPPAEGRWQGQSPYGRLYFFACAALVANVLFLTAILLDGTASIVDAICRQS